MAGSSRWWREPWFLLELFVLANLGFLTLDIYLAHSVNNFRRSAEYIPLYFSACAPVVLLAGLLLVRRHRLAWKVIGHAVGWTSIVIGLTGVVLHLDSAFFYERTLKSLTYSAPFAAPLAYAGLGFLLLLNRMVDKDSPEWAQWLAVLTLGGYVGNFVLSLTDHAANGFFNPLEWVPVATSALAVGFLLTPLLVAAVGVWGFLLHARANLAGPSIHALDNFVYGAPPFAPLLFPNLVVLGLLAVWRMWSFLPATANRT
jgi:uncharacterized membrane protein YbaN (DUF454 family)